MIGGRCNSTTFLAKRLLRSRADHAELEQSRRLVDALADRIHLAPETRVLGVAVVSGEAGKGDSFLEIRIRFQEIVAAKSLGDVVDPFVGELFVFKNSF